MTAQIKFTKLSALVATALLVVSTLQFASPIHAAPMPAALSPRSPQSGLPNAGDLAREISDDVARNGAIGLPDRGPVVGGNTNVVIEDDGTAAVFGAEAEAEAEEGDEEEDAQDDE